MGARRHSKFVEPEPALTEDEWEWFGRMIDKKCNAYGRFPGRKKMKKLGYIAFTGTLVLNDLPLYRPTDAGREAWATYKVQRDDAKSSLQS